MTGKGMIEAGVGQELVQELLAEGDGLAKQILFLQNALSHPLQLRTGEIPLVGDVRLGEIFLDGGEAADFEPVLDHFIHIAFRHLQLARRDQIHLHMIEQLQPVRLAVDRSAVIEIAHQRHMNGIEAHAVVLQEAEFIQQLLCGVFVLPVSRVDKRRGVGETVALCVNGGLLGEQLGQTFDGAANDENAVLIAGNGIEGIRIGFPLVDGGTTGQQLADLGVMELRRVLEAFSGTGGILQKHGIDPKVRVVDAEFILLRLVVFQNGFFQLHDLVEQVTALLDRKILNDIQRSSLKNIHRYGLLNKIIPVLSEPARKQKKKTRGAVFQSYRDLF